MEGVRLRGRGGFVGGIVSCFFVLFGVREMEGCANVTVVNRDDYVSRWRNTNFGREEALRQIL